MALSQTLNAIQDKSIKCLWIGECDRCSRWKQWRENAEIEKAPNRITIETEFSEEKKSIVVEIADNGTGMPEEVKVRIFEQGFTTKEVGKGTGLGMAIAHQIVTEKHGRDRL